MKRKILQWIKVLLVLVLAWSLFKIYTYYKNDRAYKNLMATYAEERNRTLSALATAEQGAEDSETLSTEAHEILGAQALVEHLHHEYPHVIARLLISNLDMDFPVCQGADNAFYLDHDYTGAYHPFGAVFLDKRNDKNLEDENSVLYGHNVESGAVFHALDAYRDRAYVKEHPEIVVDTLDARCVYEIVAVYEADAYEDYRSPSYDDAGWEEFASRISHMNLLGDETFQRGDKILTLSTCTDYDHRLVVQGRLKERIPYRSRQTNERD